MNGETPIVLAWATVGIGLLLSLGGLLASLYFARIDRALTGNWVIHGRLNTCRTITIVAFGLTVIRAVVLINGPSVWAVAFQGLLVIWLLTIPIQLWRNAVAHEGIGASLPQPETEHQREDRERGEVSRALEAKHRADEPRTQDQVEDLKFGEQRRELEAEHLADTPPEKD